ncbi:TonB-dependent receptor [Adhaeribacter swui]|uniref:TonB-dependent receptor n=1 Tax=Adhaeribacter swui TaxID=2086471 RepID=A0A7G7G7R9_9BACT|nr:TonB-dependent receptor [Adhaeribacter swui]QNF33203.1 TonB-dependent receptor [Adhaeribacter swui]
MKLNLLYLLPRVAKTLLPGLFLFLITFSIVLAEDLPLQNLNKAKVTLNLSNVSLKEFIAAIETQTPYRFTLDEQEVDQVGRISVNAQNESLLKILEQVTASNNLEFKQINNNIHLRQQKSKILKNEQNNQSLKKPVPARVSGVVKSVTGETLPGVTVLVKGTTVGTTTATDGSYTLDVPDNTGTLVFSFIGFITREVPVNSEAVINVTLTEDTQSLKEVVVVGYGTQQRGDITSAVATVSTKSIENQPLAGLDQAIAGQAAGVQAAQRSGTPGGGVTVRVRGTGSIGAGNEPLYVVDGFPIEGDYNRDLNPLATINPNDIESIQILKDASSAAIYGSRGSNGVVIITTKRGKAGKTRINLNTYYGVQQVANKIDMLNAREYAEYNTEARNNAWVDAGGNASDPNSVRPDRFKIPPMFADPASLGKGTDWQDEVFRTAPIQNYELSASGGNENSQFLISGSYFNQQGVVLKTGFERYSFRVNLDTKVSDKIKLGVNLAPSYSTNDVLPVEDQVFTGGILAAALSMAPTIPVYNPDGTYTTQLGVSPYVTGIIENPVAIANKIKGGTAAFRTLGTFFGEYAIVKGLTFKTSLGVDYTDSRSNFYHPSDLGRDGASAPVIPIANASSSRGIILLNENTLTFDRTFNDHNITALAGFTNQKARGESANMFATNFPNDLVMTLNAGQVTSGGTSMAEWSLLSFLGRVNYSYKSKYLFTATVRQDGSSRFGAGNKWGTFPSASVGWNIAQENFMSHVTPVSDFKIRASYGLAGNNTIGNYNHIGLLSATRYVFGPGTGTIVNGLQPTSISNQNLSWEKMDQLDLGVDIGLLKNRLFLTVDYYNKNTSDLLLSVPVPSSTGYTTALQNIGKINNKGWEFALNSKNLVNAFTWNTDFNISFNKNKVLALGPSGDPIISKSPSFSPNTHITQIGSPIGSFYGYEVIGIYQNQADVDNSPAVRGVGGSKPGDLKYHDVNGDGQITGADVTIIGDNQPDFTYGFTNTFGYKDFSLSVLIDGAEGFELLNGSRRNIGLVSGSYSRRDVLNRWQSPENPGDGKTPRANVVPTGGNLSYVSSLLVEDASFLRIRNINLRYRLPEKVFKYVRAQNGSLSFSVQNAFTFTKYLGYNPEQSFQGTSPLTPGVDYNGYPVARTFTLGLNITF